MTNAHTKQFRPGADVETSISDGRSGNAVLAQVVGGQHLQVWSAGQDYHLAVLAGNIDLAIATHRLRQDRAGDANALLVPEKLALARSETADQTATLEQQQTT